jgi:hypothetical protein
MSDSFPNRAAVKHVAKLLLGDDCTIHDQAAHWYFSADHPALPIGLSFHAPTYGRRQHIEVTAELSQETRALARNGTGLTGQLYSYQEQAPRTPFRRNIRVDRWEADPATVAAEIRHHVYDPARPVALKALQDITERAGREARLCATLTALAEDCGLTYQDRRAGEEHRLWSRKGVDLNARLYSTGNGEVTFSGSTERLARIIRLVHAAETGDNSGP